MLLPGLSGMEDILTVNNSELLTDLLVGIPVILLTVYAAVSYQLTATTTP